MCKLTFHVIRESIRQLLIDSTVVVQRNENSLNVIEERLEAQREIISGMVEAFNRSSELWKESWTWQSSRPSLRWPSSFASGADTVIICLFLV
jgi:hypothetical protein